MKGLIQRFRNRCCLSAVLIAALAALALGGCGSGGSSARADSSATITKAGLINEGDSICRKTDQTQEAGLAAYKEEHGSDPSKPAEEEEVLLKFGLPPVKTEIEELNALGAPKADKAQIAELLHELNEALKSAERDPRLFLQVGGAPEFAKADALAKKYGFKDCADAL